MGVKSEPSVVTSPWLFWMWTVHVPVVPSLSRTWQSKLFSAAALTPPGHLALTTVASPVGAWPTSRPCAFVWLIATPPPQEATTRLARSNSAIVRALTPGM